jgi:hypothetical protein
VSRIRLPARASTMESFSTIRQIIGLYRLVDNPPEQGVSVTPPSNRSP